MSTAASSSPSSTRSSSVPERDGAARLCACTVSQADAAALRRRIEEDIRAHDLIPNGGEVAALVSGGADSTCLWHVLGALGYRVSALHVNHGLRGAESDEDARFCREVLGAEVVDGRGGTTEDDLRRIRYSFATDRLRATGHTASDQVETVLYRLVSSGVAGGIKPKREDGVVRPLLPLWREETQAYCERRGARVPHRQLEPGDAPRPDPRRDSPAPAPPPPGRREEPSPSRREAPVEARRPARRDDRLPPRRPRRRPHRGARIRPRLARADTRRVGGSGALGRVDDRVGARRP